MAELDFDIVLYGATGFTGTQTVKYFSQYAPKEIRWAVAGRDRQKLENLNAGAPVVAADSKDRSQVADLVSRTRVLLTTAGPFAPYGDEIVGACVEAGTHYVDITGETAWVRDMIDRYHEKATEQGTKIVPFCGFDSVPADLGVSILAKELGGEIAEVKAYFESKGGKPNGGTVVTGLTTYDSGAAERMRDPFLLNPETKRALHPMERDPTSAVYDKNVGCWVAPFPMGLIDTRVVRRSCSLIGLDVAFQEYTIIKGAFAPLRAATLAGGSALLSTAMNFASFRDMVRKSAQSGNGPPPDAMENGWFRCQMVGRSRTGRGAEVLMVGKGDPANRITVMCVCESALALACDSEKLPSRAGVLTPSVAIGEILIHRLRERGVAISLTTSS